MTEKEEKPHHSASTKRKREYGEALPTIGKSIIYHLKKSKGEGRPQGGGGKGGMRDSSG